MPTPPRRPGSGAFTDSSAPPPFTLEPPRQLDERFLNLLIYGKYGHGKTTLATTALDEPSMRDVIMFAAEPGELSIASRQDLDILRITQYSQLARGYEYLRRHVQLRDSGDLAGLLALEQRLKPNQVITVPKQYRTVIIDSVSEVQKYLMYQLLNIDYMTTKLDAEPDVAEQRDWLHSAEMIRILIRAFRDLPMHVIFVASSIEPEKKVKDEIKLPGQLSADIQGFLDMVGYLIATKEKDQSGEERITHRRLYIGAGYPLWDSKNRFEHVRADYVDEPTIPKILELDRQEAELARTAATAANRRSTTGSRPGTPRTTTRSVSDGDTGPTQRTFRTNATSTRLTPRPPSRA